MSLSDLEIADPAPEITENAQPKKKIFKQTLWVLFALFCLVFFTLFKLPEDRIRAYLQGQINDALASQGVILSAAQSSTSIGFGASYTMKQVTLSFMQPRDPVKIDQIKISPSLISLVTGKIGGHAEIENHGGQLSIDFMLPARPKPGALPMELDLDANKMDLTSLGLLKIATGVDGGAVLDGKVQLSGDFNVPSSLSGQVDMKLAKINVDAQSFMGFSIPHIAVADGKIDVSIKDGKLSLHTFQLGKASKPNDDIHANVTSNGDMVLGRTWAQTNVNVKTDFGFSQNVVKALPLIDALLSGGHQPDGSYAYLITGPVSGVVFAPAPGLGK